MNRHLDRIAVTGGTGFIGRGVLKALQRRGARVSALLRPGGQPPTDAPKDTVWIEGRLGDASAEAALLQDAEAVIHLAGLTKALSRSAFLEINAAAAGALAERAAAAGVKRFVLASSIAARAPEMSDYAASKRAGEDAVRSAAGDMDALIVRLPAIIGADDAATRPLVQALRAGVFPVPGGEAGRRARFSLAHVDDIARALVDWTLEGADDQKLIEPYGVRSVGWTDVAAAGSVALRRQVRVLPLSPALLALAATLFSAIAWMARHPTHTNPGKINELLHPNMTGDVEIAGAYDLSSAIALALGVDAAAKSGQIERPQEVNG